jgi:peptidoglycan/xylan/chitin deacetylase (PgdA/CDA1 family)
MSATQVARLLPAADVAGFVVTLHHVRPAKASGFQPNALLSITPDFLDRFLAHFKQQGWRFVSVDELVVPSADAGDARRIAVTLDDGYRNNLDHALPVFRRQAVPFTIYVCPGFSDRTAELWWEALERIIASADLLAAPGGKGTLATADVAGKTQAFLRWMEWLTTDADETTQRVAIRALAEAHKFDLAALARELVMDWDEVRTIAADPLCSIGAHTMTHAALARLSQRAAFDEIAASVDRIAKEIGRRPTSIAFPYGYPSAAGPREAELAAQAGLAASFTTQPGAIPAEGRRHGLPRVSVNGLFQKLRYFDVLLTPGLWALRDRLLKRA